MDGSDGVYPASEDTYLLIDCLEKQKSVIENSVNNYGVCVEIGCGSGEVSAELAEILPNAYIISTDVNIKATEKTKCFMVDKKISSVNIVVCDMFTAFKSGLLFDLIIFNPPYVPTDRSELDRALRERDIVASWAGGQDGREVIDVFLSQVGPFLANQGYLYLVVLDTNKPAELLTFAAEHNLNGKIVDERRAGIEKLYIMRFQKLKPT